LSDTRDSSSRKAPAGTFALHRAGPDENAEWHRREHSSVFTLRRPSLPRGVADVAHASDSIRAPIDVTSAR
jgi:hypothetical protein